MSEPTHDERRLAMSHLLARLTLAKWITGSYVNEKHVRIEFTARGLVCVAELKELLSQAGCPRTTAEAQALEQVLNLPGKGPEFAH
jgi:hypothetical protein